MMSEYKIDILKNKIDGTKQNMINNFDSLLKRDEELQDIDLKVNEMTDNSTEFNTHTNHAKNKYRLKFIILAAILLLLILAMLILLIIIIVVAVKQ